MMYSIEILACCGSISVCHVKAESPCEAAQKLGLTIDGTPDHPKFWIPGGRRVILSESVEITNPEQFLRLVSKI